MSDFPMFRTAPMTPSGRPLRTSVAKIAAKKNPYADRRISVKNRPRTNRSRKMTSNAANRARRLRANEAAKRRAEAAALAHEIGELAENIEEAVNVEAENNNENVEMRAAPVNTSILPKLTMRDIKDSIRRYKIHVKECYAAIKPKIRAIQGDPSITKKNKEILINNIKMGCKRFAMEPLQYWYRVEKLKEAEESSKARAGPGMNMDAGRRRTRRRALRKRGTKRR